MNRTTGRLHWELCKTSECAAITGAVGDVRLSTSTARTIEAFQAKRGREGAANRTINMDV